MNRIVARSLAAAAILVAGLIGSVPAKARETGGEPVRLTVYSDYV